MRQAVETLAEDFPRGHRIEPHRHPCCQLIYARRGVMRVTTAMGIWVVPPERGLWMPAGREHAIVCATPVAMRTLYIDVASSEIGEPWTARGCAVLWVTPLAREVLVALCERDPHPARRELLTVLKMELATLGNEPLHLPEPRDPRLARIGAILTEAPGDPRGLHDWARLVGTSRRTLIRLFQRDVGMSYGSWRRQLRLLTALERLAAGAGVTEVAMDLGYDSLSAFTANFRRTLGTTPSRYFTMPKAGSQAVGVTRLARPAVQC